MKPVGPGLARDTTIAVPEALAAEIVAGAVGGATVFLSQRQTVQRAQRSVPRTE